jgi:DNA-binding XRE family transcriptional regulator
LPIYHITLKASKPSKIIQNPQSLGEHIRKKRMELNLFQKDVAKIIGVEETSIYNWENNQSKPRSRYMSKIIKFLGYILDIYPQKTVGEKLTYYRNVNGLSQKQMAMELGIDQSTLRMWEKNICLPNKKISDKIFKIL